MYGAYKRETCSKVTAEAAEYSLEQRSQWDPKAGQELTDQPPDERARSEKTVCAASSHSLPPGKPRPSPELSLPQTEYRWLHQQ